MLSFWMENTEVKFCAGISSSSSFFLKVFGGHTCPFFEATGTPVLDFWWHLLWGSKPEWVLPYLLFAEVNVMYIPRDPLAGFLLDVTECQSMLLSDHVIGIFIYQFSKRCTKFYQMWVISIQEVDQALEGSIVLLNFHFEN